MLLFWGMFSTLAAQCIAVPAFPGCAPAGSVALVSGASIGVGQTHTFSGTSTYAGVTINGGTLIVCGNLTLNSFSMSSGNIIVQAGASLTIFNGGAAIVLGANSNIYNYGAVIFRVSLVTGANNIIMNALSSSSFTVPFDQLVIQGPNTFLVNSGSMQSSFFIVQSTNAPNCICMGNGSTIVTNTLINQFTNAFNTPVGLSCINVLQNVINANQVANTSGVNVCIPAGINIISGPNWGSATVTNNCINCGVPLPVELVQFDGYCDGNRNMLTWSTATEVNNCTFFLQRSLDCVVFETVGQTPGAVNSNTLNFYQMEDAAVARNTLYYYRLKQADCNGTYVVSNIISLLCMEQNCEWMMGPNPVEEVLNLYGGDCTNPVISMYNSAGQLVKNEISGPGVYVGDLASGMYYVIISTPDHDPVVKKLLKK